MAFCWAKKCRDNTVQLPNLRYCDHEFSKHKLILKPGFQVDILQATPWAIPYLLSSYRVRTHPRLHLAIPRWTWLVDAWSSCDLVVRTSTESANLIPSWAWWQLHRSPTRRCCPPMAILCCLFFFNGQNRSRQKCTPCDRKIPMAYVPLPKRLAAEKLIFFNYYLVGRFWHYHLPNLCWDHQLVAFDRLLAKWSETNTIDREGVSPPHIIFATGLLLVCSQQLLFAPVSSQCMLWAFQTHALCTFARAMRQCIISRWLLWLL